jgi:PAS domain S-box-containing protein
MSETEKKTDQTSKVIPSIKAVKNQQQAASGSDRIDLKRSPEQGEKSLKYELERCTFELRQTRLNLKRAIAERRKIEIAHERKRTILEEVIACAGGPVFSVDRRYCYTSFNAQHAEVMKGLFGADIEIGQNLLDYHTNAGDRASAKKNIDRAFKGETVIIDSYAGEEVRSRRYFEIIHYPLRGSKDEVMGAAIYARDITEQKHSEDIQNWLSSFPERNPSPVVEVDFDGNVHYLNLAARRAFPDLQERRYEHPWLRGMEKVIEEFKNGIPETIIRDVMIRDTYFQQTISCIIDSQRVRIYSSDITGRVKAEDALRLARDELGARVQERTQELVTTNKQLQNEINERKRAETALLESERRYRTLFETSPDGFIMIGMNLKILFANQRAASLYGFKNPKKIIGISVDELIAPEDRQRIRESILETFVTGVARDIEYKFLNKKGTSFPAELNASVVLDSLDSPIGFLMDIRDITERKWAEESLKLAYAYNRSLIEASLDPFVTISPGGKIGDVNKATEAVTGFTRVELIGTDFHSYFTNPEKARAGYQQAFETGDVRGYEFYTMLLFIAMIPVK